MVKEITITDKLGVIEENLSEGPPKKKVVPVVKEETPIKTDSIPPKQKKVKKTKKKKVVRKFSFKKFLLPIIAILTLSGIGSFYYFSIYKVQPTSPEEILPFSNNFISSIESLKAFAIELTLLSKPDEPRTEESPLNGLLFTKTEMDEMMARRPVAVMMNNHSIARPQSGLNSADIVIESNVEGGITRYLVFFWSEAPEKVGPIRSIRQYHLEWISEYDPIIIHDGCASSDDPRVNACGNVYFYGLKDIQTVGAWRWNDGTRYAPHNEYSSITNAWEYAERMNWDEFPSTIDSWSFKKDADIETRGEETKVEVNFHTRLNNGGAYNALWTYDAITNSYFRKVGGQADMDQETSTQVNAKSVIIQEINLINTGDAQGHIILTTIDDGDAVFLIDGNIEYGTWEKKGRTDRTIYYDSTGKEMVFNRGMIWISVIPHSEGKFDILE